MEKWHRRFIDLALMVSTWSYCKRLQVGSVLVHDKRIISTGVNGTLSGSENCCEEDNITLKGVVHSEENCLLQCLRNGITIPDNSTLYCTHFPCYNCAKLIVNCNKITTLIYINDYKNNESIDLFKNIKIIKWNQQKKKH